MIFLLRLPIPIAILLIIVISTLFSLIILKIIKQKYTEEFLKHNHEVAGHIFNAFSFIYAVLLSFVVFLNWSEYDNATKNNYYESNEIIKIIHNVRNFPSDVRTDIENSLLSYCNIVINEEWDLLEKGIRCSNADKICYSVWDKITTMNKDSINNSVAYGQIMTSLNNWNDYRRLRYMFMLDTIPTVVWAVLIICGLISISFPYFFGMKHNVTHNILAVSFTVINALLLYLIYILDHPFIGDAKVSIEPFVQVLKYYK